MRKEVTTILEELYEVYPHLRKEEHLVSVVETFLKTKVSISPRQEFKKELRNQLLLSFPRVSFSFDVLKYIKILGSLLASGVLAYSLFSFFFVHIQPISTPVSEIKPSVSEDTSVEKNSNTSPNQEISVKKGVLSQKKPGEDSDIAYHQDIPTPKKSLEQPQKGEASITQDSSTQKSSSKERDYVGSTSEQANTLVSDVGGANMQDSRGTSFVSDRLRDASFIPDTSLKSSAPFMGNMMVSSEAMPASIDQTKYSFEIVGPLSNIPNGIVYSLEKKIQTPQGYELYYDTITQLYSLSRSNVHNDSGSVTIRPNDIPSSEELMRQISSFLSTIGVSSSNYELSPGYISSLLSSVFDQNISINLPYLLNGKEVYDNLGNKLFLQLDYNLLSKEFQYVGGIFSLVPSQDILSQSALFLDNGVSSQKFKVQLTQGVSVYVKLNLQGKVQFVPGHIYTVVKKVGDFVLGQKFLYPDVGGGDTPIQTQE